MAAKEGEASARRLADELDEALEEAKREVLSLKGADEGRRQAELECSRLRGAMEEALRGKDELSKVVDELRR